MFKYEMKTSGELKLLTCSSLLDTYWQISLETFVACFVSNLSKYLACVGLIFL